MVLDRYSKQIDPDDNWCIQAQSSYLLAYLKHDLCIISTSLEGEYFYIVNESFFDFYALNIYKCNSKEYKKLIRK